MIRFDARLDVERLDEVPALARQAEEAGITALWTSEAQHDPFFP
ncbi:MAG: LLM class F420-dependent oxidoreductase, partial [Deltaproteobacteria bacterium]|nr:LLM class F420-dependent oxidoreductase [Deltaproteobacteria bacterium]